MTPRPTLRRRWHVLWLGLLTLLMAVPGLGSIPVIDRDEARYAQSSVQMVESGDFVEIRLGGEARNKKPVGAYWAQAAAITATGGLGERPGQTLWAQRLPSVLAAVAAVWLTFLAGVPMLGRRGAALAGALLATSLIFTFEAHIAKTDALLLGATSGVLAALARLRAGRPRGMAWLFWGALGAAVLIKGPVGPAIAGLALVVLLAWERKARWARPLLNPLAIALFLAVVAPWLVAIGLATDGQFFADSLGGDLGGKLAGAAENHGGPPGFYLATVWVALWPASLLLVPGAVFAWQAARRGGDGLPARGQRLVIAWVAPFWLVLEAVPTKLIHYTLPLFPALCIAMAGAALAVAGAGAFPRARAASALAFVLASAAVLGIVASVQVGAGDPRLDALALAVVGVSGLAALVAAWGALRARLRLVLIGGAVVAVPLSVLCYGVLLPAVDGARVSERVARRAAPPLLSPDYAEASLLYYGGRDAVRLGPDADWARWDSWRGGTLAVDQSPGRDLPGQVMERAARDGVCLRGAGTVSGINYSRGRGVEILLLRQVPCAAEPGAP